MAQAKHRYRLSIYLGRDTYEEIKAISDYLKLPMATTTRVILETGLQISKQLEKGAQANGFKQPEI